MKDESEVGQADGLQNGDFENWGGSQFVISIKIKKRMRINKRPIGGKKKKKAFC